MTISVQEIFNKCGLEACGVVKWGERIPLDAGGIYAVASTPDLDDSSGSRTTYVGDQASFMELQRLCPSIEIDGRTASAADLASRIGSFWIPDAAILYVGLAGTSVQKRVQQFYRTPIGHRSPHSGGWWLKTLARLEDVYIHYAAAEDPKTKESLLLSAFADSVPGSIRATLHDAERVAPFANVEIRPGVRKRHGLTGYKLSR